MAAKSASDGWTAYESGHFKDAKILLERAVRLSPNQPDYHAALGLIELKTGDQAEAVRHLKIAVRLKPTDTEFRLHLASVYQDANDDLAALQVLRIAKVDDALSGTWHFTRGFSLFRIGRYGPARAEFELLLNDPQFTAPADFFLGSIAFSENRFEDAVSYFEPAVRLGNSEKNKAYNAYTYDYGLALFKLAKYQDAEEQFKASIERYDRDPLPWMFAGRCEQALGRYKTAIDMLERATKIDPDLSLAQYELARLQQRYGDPARAAELFAKIGRMKEEEVVAEERRAMKLKTGSPRP
jgi:tetratricopeptide (TPR) repeat protein